MDRNILSDANNTAWPKDNKVTGTYYGHSFAGVIREGHCRWIGGTFIYSIETTSVSPSFAEKYGEQRTLDFYATPREVAMGHSLTFA